ncbi:MAG: 2,3-bisphosphoglycerate-independent phosphoglycerate mutase [Proteobacteria bacterium]|nr:2,3-bisphosphoglycerate-independent phosphoglycerate mutase [Pseudomonadota bacterium]
MNVAVSTESHKKAGRPKPVVLAILDGWGYRVEKTDNAIALANVPTWNRFLATCPHGLVETSGLDVGLPPGQMGNSEVGHMNIGAGRVMMQDLPRIDAAIETGAIQSNPALSDFIAKLKASGGTAHMIGLLSPGGVHSHMDQMAALARIISGAGVPVAIHALMDGRDTPPSSGLGFMEAFQKQIAGLARTKIATVGGRYYGMDRDKRWDRVEKAYAAMTEAKGHHAADPLAAIRASYDERVTDEFMLPAAIGDYRGMQDGDGVLMANFRADRARQILSALLWPAFDGFARARVITFAAATGLTEYSQAHNTFMTVMFPAESGGHTLGQIISEAGLKQLRIAETEKYAHVTFFLNGGVEQEFPGEERILIQSPKVATYDLQPEMSAPDVTDRIVEAIESGRFDAIIVNYANGDMVGHTGILAAAIKAAETIDACLTRLEAALKKAGGTMLICADHGNLELMKDPATHEPHTQHTVGVVPTVLVNGPADVTALKNGRLADIAPTVLALMQLPKPPAMTGASLLIQHADAQNAALLARRAGA